MQADAKLAFISAAAGSQHYGKVSSWNGDVKKVMRKALAALCAPTSGLGTGCPRNCGSLQRRAGLGPSSELLGGWCLFGIRRVQVKLWDSSSVSKPWVWDRRISVIYFIEAVSFTHPVCLAKALRSKSLLVVTLTMSCSALAFQWHQQQELCRMLFCVSVWSYRLFVNAENEQLLSNSDWYLHLEGIGCCFNRGWPECFREVTCEMS